MSYATQQDLIDRYGEPELIQLTDRNSAGAVDATVVTRALTDTDAEMNSYLAVRYSLPLAATPVVLTRFACSIARRLLYDDAATERVEADYKTAIAFMKSVAKGEVDLGLTATNLTTAAVGGPKISTSHRTFSKDLLSDY